MKKMRFGMVVMVMLVCLATSAMAQVSIGIGFPSVSIGINLPLLPELVPVPGYPVYYAPRVDGNYFFYDGMYWVYQDDNWYTSSWYNGPWGFVDPQVVPLFILRIPVRYYQQPPVYFSGWQSNAPPRWGQHWGNGWERRRSGWNRWNRSSAPVRAPLPVYQRQYTGDRYPRVEQQQTLRTQSYRYQPRDKVVRRHLQQVRTKTSAPAQRGRQEQPQVRTPAQQNIRRQAPPQHGAPADPRSQSPQRGSEHVQRPAPVHAAPQQPAAQQQPRAQQHQQQPAAPQRQQAPRAQGQEHKDQDRGGGQGSNRGQGQRQDKDEERGRGRNN
ncbi:MAG: hypothetical protein WC007_06970 [Pelobacteraceae bacterium]